jgi:hypothetical protein
VNQHSSHQVRTAGLYLQESKSTGLNGSISHKADVWEKAGCEWLKTPHGEENEVKTVQWMSHANAPIVEARNT